MSENSGEGQRPSDEQNMPEWQSQRYAAPGASPPPSENVSHDQSAQGYGQKNNGPQDYRSQEYGLPQYGSPQYGSPQYGSPPQGNDPQRFGSQHQGNESQGYGSQGYGSQGYDPGPADGMPGQSQVPPGAPSSWRNVAPEHVARMYQPGVIPLRPLNIGDIYGGSINTIRRNPEATIGMSVIVLGAFLVPSFLISLGVQSIPMNPDLALVIGTALPTVISSFATLILSGLILYVVSEAALGDKVGLGETWRAVRGRIVPLFGVSILTGLIVGLTFTLGVSLFIVSIVIREPIVVVFGVIALLITIVVVIWLTVRLLLASAPVVLEGAGPIRAIRRSWALSSGSQFWRLLGIALLAQIITFIVFLVIATPLQGILSFAALTFVSDEGILLAVDVFLQHLSQFVVGLIITPFSAGVAALLYLDQRIRREALDISMQQAASTRAAPRSRP